VNRTILLALAALGANPAPAFAVSAAPPAELTLTDPQRAAAFTAAGFHREKDGWHACGDPGDAGSYTPGSIDEIADLDGDDRPEAVISEGSGYCFGNTGVGYYLVSLQAGGGWKLIDSGAGVPEFLETNGKDGWPDLEVGGPGFCFPVLRWNGTEYAQNRLEYEGKACRP
jgi:hypothetical protein